MLYADYKDCTYPIPSPSLYVLSTVNVSTFTIPLSPHPFPSRCFPFSLASNDPSLISSVLSLSPVTFLNNPYFAPLLQSFQGKGLSKSLSMNCGKCPAGVAMDATTLSHSDSYTWAIENQRPSRSLHRDGSVSSLDSQDISFSDIYPDNCALTESQVSQIWVIRRWLFLVMGASGSRGARSMTRTQRVAYQKKMSICERISLRMTSASLGIKLCDAGSARLLSLQVSLSFLLVLHATSDIQNHVYGEESGSNCAWGK